MPRDCEIVARGIGAAVAEREIIFAGAALVGMAFDRHPHVRVAAEPVGLGVERRRGPRRRANSCRASKKTRSDGTLCRKSARDPGTARRSGRPRRPGRHRPASSRSAARAAARACGGRSRRSSTSAAAMATRLISLLLIYSSSQRFSRIGQSRSGDQAGSDPPSGVGTRRVAPLATSTYQSWPGSRRG